MDLIHVMMILKKNVCYYGFVSCTDDRNSPGGIME